MSIIRMFVGVIAVIGLWWVGTAWLSATNPILGFMTPTHTANALVYLVTEQGLLGDAGITIFRLFAGLLLAVVVGYLSGLAIGLFRSLDQLTLIPIQFIRMISPLAWMPVAVVIFGIGTPPVIFLIFIAAVWPVLLATAAAVKAVPKNWKTLATSFGGTQLETIRNVIVPAIQPGVLTGIRLAVAVSWIVLVPAEMLGVDSGLGYVVLNSRDQLAYDQLAAAMVTIGLIGFLMDLLLRKLLKPRF